MVSPGGSDSENRRKTLSMSYSRQPKIDKKLNSRFAFCQLFDAKATFTESNHEFPMKSKTTSVFDLNFNGTRRMTGTLSDIRAFGKIFAQSGNNNNSNFYENNN